MITLSVSLQIRPETRDQFLEAIEANARATSAEEPGCLQFDVICDQQDHNRFLLYEVYTDQDAVAAHRAAPHFKVWRQAADRYVLPGTQVNVLGDRLLHLT